MSDEAVEEIGNGGDITLGRHIRLFSGEPLPALDRPMARAYAAQDRREANGRLLALVCGEDLPPRIDILPTLARQDGLVMLKVVSWGLVDWTPTEERRLAIVYEQPDGRRLLASPQAKREPMSEDELVRRLVQPFVALLHALSGLGITHRAITADNVFASDDGPLVLGECASAPPGMLQPLVYETIEAGQADPGGRGAGTPADDLYALGVLLAVLLQGRDPTADMAPAEVLSAKINKGSYAALLGPTRASLGFMEPLRGLLCDDPNERWSVADLEVWANGRTLSPKQPVLPAKARRPLELAGEEHWNCRSLSMAMHIHWDEALACVRDGSLERWIRYSVADDGKSKQLLRALTGGGITPGASQESDDRLLARVLAALDPEAPLRCREFSVRLQALPAALAANWHDERRRRRFAEVVTARLPQHLLEVQTEAGVEYATLVQMLDTLRFYVTRPQIGYGLERCLYEFNPNWPCQSPLTRGQYVQDLPQLLPALERAAARGPTQGEPVDRHVAAFCAVHLQPAQDRLLQTMADPPDEPSRRLAMLRLLVEVQRRHGPRQTPHLARWLADLLEPVVETYHHRPFRERLRDAIGREAEEGDLSQLLFVADNVEAQDRDRRGFAVASEEYAEFEREIAWLRQGGLTSPEHVDWVSRDAATAISALLSGIMLIVVTLYYAA